MQAAGIDLTIFSPHSTRSASTSKAALKLPLSTILSTIGWAKESTFTKHYQKPINKGVPPTTVAATAPSSSLLSCRAESRTAAGPGDE
ncbi:hypothetical protein E2C01_035471 [Portunus trituberculatus]|uniref:Tyr recombinase domain-containing protein n=1 Tax=Portunus trituberculatus TaxID=210409 RepID=A0A5B7FBK1_PORTR|nr:hypothetical protein [Portunus trituberculatus]